MPAPLPESEIDDEGKPDTDSDKLSEVHERALTRFDSVALPQQEMRAQSLEARRFVSIPGAMWEGAFGEEYENAPRAEVDRITKSLEKIETDYRENRVMVDFVPSNDNADEMTAETLDGLYRADSYHYKAMQARDNGFQEGIRGGFGAWRLTTGYADACDPDSDAQRVNPGMTIVDADQSVYFDPASKLYDKSDAKWAFIITADMKADAEARWGVEKCVPWPTDQWRWSWDWYRPETVQIAEYFEVEDAGDTLIVMTNPLTDEEQRFFSSQIERGTISDLQAQGWKKRERKVKRDRIHKYILNGTDVLKDCGYIAGDCIPIVPFYGRRDFVDNMERWRGHVGKLQDPQRIFNSAISSVVETNARAPFQVPIVAPEQMTPAIAEQWARGNIDRTPFRYLLPLYDKEGGIVRAGPDQMLPPPQVQPGTAALLQFTGSFFDDENQNADQVKANTSADAMDIAAARVDAKSGIYLDNMRQSVQREGEIYHALARDVYFEPDRKVETMTDDEQDGVATLHEPHTDENGVFRIRNDLRCGRYKVVATVQEATATKRQRTVREALNVGQIAGELGDTELGQAALLTAMMNMDGEGMQDLQKFARNKALGIGLTKPTPEEQQQIAQAQQAQGQGQPSPADQALIAQTSELMSKTQLNQAAAAEKVASAGLKNAQAVAVGGPEQAPDAPTGLSAANDVVDIHEKVASADLKSAQAEHLRQQMGHQRIMTGEELAQAEHQREMDRRAADLADKSSEERAA